MMTMRGAWKYSPLCLRTLTRTPSVCLTVIYMYHHLYEHVDVLILFFFSNSRNDTYRRDLPTILIILPRLSRKLRQGCCPVFPFLATACVLGNSFLAAMGPRGDVIGQRARRKGAGVSFIFRFCSTSFLSPLSSITNQQNGCGVPKPLIEFMRRGEMSWSLRRMRGYWKDKGKASYIAGWGAREQQKSSLPSFFVCFAALVAESRFWC